MTVYMFDQTRSAERDRLAALEHLYDGTTRRLLTELGVRPGLRCLEVAAGGGSVALWLADQVGPHGRVTATDLDPRFLDGHGRPNLDVIVHDVVTDPLEPGAFDLIHTRALLTHLPSRHDVVARLAAALKPGGLLLVEDIDFGASSAALLGRCMGAGGPFADAATRVFLAVAQAFTGLGADPVLGTRLPGMLVAAGLVRVQAELRTPIVPGGTEIFTTGTLHHLRRHLVEGGLLDPGEIEAAIVLFEDPTLFHAPPLMVSAWGRRPGG